MDLVDCGATTAMSSANSVMCKSNNNLGAEVYMFMVGNIEPITENKMIKNHRHLLWN